MEQVPMSRKKINGYGNFVSIKENGNFTKKEKDDVGDKEIREIDL